MPSWGRAKIQQNFMRDHKALDTLKHAGVAKLADALALGASGVTHGGSSPLLGTA